MKTKHNDQENTGKRILELTLLLIFLTSREEIITTTIFPVEVHMTRAYYPLEILKKMESDNLVKVSPYSGIELTPKGRKRAVRLKHKHLVKKISMVKNHNNVCNLILLLIYLSGWYGEKEENGQRIFIALPWYLPCVLKILERKRLIWRYRAGIVLTSEGIIKGVWLRSKYIRLRGTFKNPNIEAIMEMASLLRSDVISCGKMLGEAYELLGFPLFEHSGDMFAVRYGTHRFFPRGEPRAGEKAIEIPLTNGPLPRLSKILIYDKETRDYEINTIQECNGGRLILKKRLRADYREGSVVVIFNHIVWRYNRDRTLLFRVCGGRRRNWPLKVTNVGFTYFPDSRSLLYRIELDQKELVRGFFDLVNAPFDREVNVAVS